MPKDKFWLIVAGCALLLHSLLYYPRLPDTVAYKFDFSLQPSKWCRKGMYLLLIVAVTVFVCGIALYGTAAGLCASSESTNSCGFPQDMKGFKAQMCRAPRGYSCLR